MSMDNKTDITTFLKHLYEKLLKGNHAYVIEKAEEFLKKIPKEPNVLHLSALAYDSAGDNHSAITHFKKSLVIAPHQYEVHNNLANSLKKIESTDQAIEHYRKAIELNPGFFDAWKNLGLTYLEKNQLTDAEKCLKRAESLQPDNVSIISSIASLLKTQHNYPGAIAYYLKALRINPKYVPAIHNLALLYKLTERYDDAIGMYNQAKQLTNKIPQLDYNCGNAYFEIGQYNNAEKCYIEAIGKQPLYVDAHKSLNELYWQLGQLDKFGKSFEEALALNSSNRDLRKSYIELLISAKKYEDAHRVLFESSKKQNNNDVELELLEAKLLAASGNHSDAEKRYESILTRNYSLETAQDLVKILIINKNIEKASSVLDLAQKENYLSQKSWAYRSICWKEQKDERYAWLNNYDDFLRCYSLPTPNGYSNLHSFISDLKELILQMHRTHKAPLTQTLKNGTQTPGRLLYKPFHEIELLKKAFNEAIHEYISELNSDVTHPFLSRKSNLFEIAGSWSVKLFPGGFHSNHIHPEGWISSSFYVHLPKNIKDGKMNNNEGYIKFGENHLTNSSPDKVIKPEVGKLVLFPSYFWHGTNTFKGSADDYRLTVPFDVVPK